MLFSSLWVRSNSQNLHTVVLVSATNEEQNLQSSKIGWKYWLIWSFTKLLRKGTTSEASDLAEFPLGDCIGVIISGVGGRVERKGQKLQSLTGPPWLVGRRTASCFL